MKHASTRAFSSEARAALRASNPDSPSLPLLDVPGVTAVVTGQQVGLFLGPLYTVYKAASAVVTARALARESGQACVPVFWLQSEDHDVEEVRHTSVQLLDGTVQRLEVDADDARVSLGARRLGPSVQRALDTLRAALEGTPHGDEVLSLLEHWYRPDAGYVDAFSGVLRALFREHGLLLFDVRSVDTTAIHHRALELHHETATRLQQRSEALESAGFGVQVPIRPSASLCFAHLDGARHRLEWTGTHWSHHGRSIEPRSVESWSSSALLRPIVQDTLLPTAAVVLGPGELNYFAQLAPLYEAFHLPMPMVVPRARFRVLTPREVTLMQTLGLAAAQLEGPLEAVLQLSPAAKEAMSATDVHRLVETALTQALAQVPVLDESIRDGVELTRGTIRRAVGRLAGRYAQSLGRRDATFRSRVERLRTTLLPEGHLQERLIGWPSIAARVGIERFTQVVLDGVQPFASDVRELVP